jgi:hypothetical protein
MLIDILIQPDIILYKAFHLAAGSGRELLKLLLQRCHQMCILYNQRDATYTIFFIIVSALHVSGDFSAHHQELIKQYVQPWVLSCFLLSTAGVAVLYNPSTPAVDSADNNKEHCISCISLVI